MGLACWLLGLDKEDLDTAEQWVGHALLAKILVRWFYQQLLPGTYQRCRGPMELRCTDKHLHPERFDKCLFLFIVQLQILLFENVQSHSFHILKLFIKDLH